MIKKYILAIDLGGTNIKIGILDPGYKIISKETVPTRLFKDRKDLIKGIVNSIQRSIKQQAIKKSSILGLGVGLPGPTDTQKGIVHFLPNIPGWKEVPLKKILERRLHIPVFVDNDAKVMTLAELTRGAAKKFKNVLCVTLGTGVGGGLILGGRIYRGSDNASGEIGHLPINEVGPRCNCGGLGCLETYVGNNRILKRAKRIIGKEISLEVLSHMAGAGNKKAREIWRRAGEQLGVAFAGVTNILNLDAIVVGGGVAAAGKILFDSVKATLKRRAMSVQGQRVKILKARLAHEAGLVGAAVLVKESLK